MREYSDVISEIRRLAKADPDRIGVVDGEDNCRYINNGQPSCIVGHALWNLGEIGPGLELNTCLNVSDAEGLLDALGFKGEKEEAQWIHEVQVKQDQRVPWADAVAAADSMYEVAA